MSDKSPTQFILVEHKEPCRFCWLEKREFVNKLSRIGGVDGRQVERLISTWVRHNAPNLPLPFIYGVFTVASNIFFFHNPLLFSLVISAIATAVVALIRLLAIWLFYRRDDATQNATIVEISAHTHSDVQLVAKWTNDTLTELFLWRQFPRGVSLVVSSIYAAVTLNFIVAGMLGFLLWLVFGILRYRLWDWGHHRLDTIDFSRHGAYRAELRLLWSDFFHLSYFVFTGTVARWSIGFSCLFIVLIRLGSIVEPGQSVYGYNWYFYFIITNLLISLKNDIV